NCFSLCVLFFFSSRRRHTRFSRDWSSDVCSSDLGNGFLAPSDRLNLGFIGVGKQMYGLLNQFMKLPETMVIAAADVDSSKLNNFIGEANKLNASKAAHQVQGFGQYRDLLAIKDIDAVIIASPDHWHAMHVVDAA